MSNSGEFSRAALEETARLVHTVMPPTAQYAWPLLARRAGSEVWVKHENHTPTGAFKIRGGLAWMDDFRRLSGGRQGIVAATRGNHGQSIACAAARAGLAVTIVVPHGNSREKNAAMVAFGATLVTHGDDFNEALDHARALADSQGLHMAPSFHPLLVRGVASYAMELFAAVADLHTVYVPIGLGSGLCGVIAARDALGLATRVVGVVAAEAPAYALSFDKGEAVATNSAETLADGMAVRIPDPAALDMIRAGADRIVRVSEEEIRAAMRHLFIDTHNVAEGAGAAALAALLQEGPARAGGRAAVILSGGNVDRHVFAEVLADAG
ncbi:MAG: threonine dehydratase [Alphaproteobacteria bacterium]